MSDAAGQLRAQLTLRDDLRAALSLLRVRDVREFLLGTDARMDAAIVTASGVRSRSMAMEVRTESEAVGAAELDDNFSFSLVSNWLFMPAVKRNAYSLGVHLCQDDCRTRVGLFKPAFTVCRYRRYVRDRVRGAYISVAFFGSEMELIFLPNLGKSLRHRTGKWFRFNANAFRATMAAAMAADTIPDMEAVLESLNVVYTFSEVRHCPECGALPETPCECPPSGSQACSMYFKNNTNGRRGVYMGGAVIDFLMGGVSFRSVRLKRRSFFDFTQNRSLRSELISWAARDRLSELSPSLTKLVMPAEGGRQPEPICIGVDDGALRGVSNDYANRSVPQLQQGTTIRPEGVTCSEDANANHSIPQLDVDSNLQDIPLTAHISNFTTSMALDILRNEQPLRAAAPVKIAHRPRGPVAETRRQPRVLSPVDPVEPLTPSPLPNTIASGALRLRNSSRSVSSELEAGTVAANENGGILNSNKITRGLQVIKEYGGSSNITPEQLRRIVPMSDRELIITHRRARNRESAAYTNLRRKIKLQTLRSDVIRVRKRKVECSERVRALLRENQALRDALSRAGKSVPGRANISNIFDAGNENAGVVGQHLPPQPLLIEPSVNAGQIPP